MISIIIPLYNKERYILSTIDSILAQTYKDYEVVIIDDGSTDNGPKIVRQLKNPKIRVITQENAGVSAARNHGIIEAKGELICFLDADDIWMPDYLETQYRLYLEFPDCAMFATNYLYKGRTGQIRQPKIHGIAFSGNRGIVENYFDVICQSNPLIWTGAVMVKKEAAMAIGMFPIELKSGEDIVLWGGIAAKYRKIAYCKEPKAYFVDTPLETNINKNILRRGGTALFLETISNYKTFCRAEDKVHIERYYAHCVKSSAISSFEGRDSKMSRKLCLEGIRLGQSKILYLIYILNFLPYKIAASIFYKLRSLKDKIKK